MGVIVYGVIRAPGWGRSAADGIHEVFLGILPSMLSWTIKGRCWHGILSPVDNACTAKAASRLTQSSTSLQKTGGTNDSEQSGQFVYYLVLHS